MVSSSILIAALSPGLAGARTAAAARQALYQLGLSSVVSDDVLAEVHPTVIAAVGRLLGIRAVFGGGIETVACGRYPYVRHRGLPPCVRVPGSCCYAGAVSMSTGTLAHSVKVLNSFD